MTTDDPANFRGRYRSALDSLDDSDTVHGSDREVIRNWLRDRDGSLAVSSLLQYCCRLRALSERSPTPLVGLSHRETTDLF